MLPSPGVLRTPTVPPCASTMRLVSARPSPVPGYFLALPASSCWNSTNRCGNVLGGDADAGVLDLEPEAYRPRSGRTRTVTLSAVGRELDGVRQVVVEHLLELSRGRAPPSASAGRLRCSSAMLVSAASDLRSMSRTSPTTGASVDRLGAELHLAGLDLGQVEHVVDELQQVARAGEDVAQVLLVRGESPGPTLPSCISSAKPMIAFSGVRSSCDMLARNSLFRRLAS